MKLLMRDPRHAGLPVRQPGPVTRRGFGSWCLAFLDRSLLGQEIAVLWQAGAVAGERAEAVAAGSRAAADARDSRSP
ncbi:hypothetical protein [Caldimonas tepidiphila]|uniref:hypothetical protein n=1 Tax=Caldimonas tepidiphila TaxID=2315841 RepID=UPI000E5A5087|nr:hypothetical protein [Caldimonas tepidiphila]